jgi:hypothetical protein
VYVLLGACIEIRACVLLEELGSSSINIQERQASSDACSSEQDTMYETFVYITLERSSANQEGKMNRKKDRSKNKEVNTVCLY